MPLIKSTYQPLRRYRNAHIQTILPSLFRKVTSVYYERQRINTVDGDFIDLDWSYAAATRQPSNSLAILCHGLEGSADRAYMLGMAQAFNASWIDAVAYNFRGCSGEINQQKKFYNAGATDDLQEVLNAIIKPCQYQDIYLVGFSLGANLVLKYGGEKGKNIHPVIKGIAAISAPCELRSSSLELLKSKNYVYSLRFLKMLLAKVIEKSIQYPELKSIDLKSIKDLKQFDDHFTAPLAGYKDAEDYWYKASCMRELDQITIPTLIVNAADDPILGPECYPYKQAQANEFIFLEVPEQGGHVGFMHRPNQTEYWHESRTVSFLMHNRGLDFPASSNL